MATTFDLSGKSVLITGAARGLGRALAIGAAQAGATVAAFDLDAGLLAELRTVPSITPYVVDVVDRAAFVAAAARIGRIDAVVNNAMLIRYDPIEAVDEADSRSNARDWNQGRRVGRSSIVAPHGSCGRRRRSQSRLAHRGARLPDHGRLQYGEGRHGHPHSNPRRGTRSAPRARQCAGARLHPNARCGRHHAAGRVRAARDADSTASLGARGRCDIPLRCIS